MSITATCLCGAKLRAHEKDAGRTGRCPKCGRSLTVNLVETPPEPPFTSGVVCFGCSQGRPPARDGRITKDMPSCSRCGFRGHSFTGDPGSVWRNETSTFLYQMTPSFIACCGVCLQRAHHIGFSWAISLHEGCVCIQKLLKPGDTSLPFLDLPDLLRKLTPAQQDALMGRNNWLLFRAALVDWDSVVTEGRVREFHEVMDLARLGVEDVVKAGVPEAEARAAWDLVHTPERAALDERRARIYQAMLDKGLTPEQIRAAVGVRIGGRVAPEGPPRRKW